jgi:hypothetical protein
MESGAILVALREGNRRDASIIVMAAAGRPSGATGGRFKR